jgi:hypothetical protein
LFKKRLNKDCSVAWSLTYICFRYLHYLVLLFLFVYGKDINQLRNLGFMCFFTIFVAFDWLYRKYMWVLSLFIAFFLFGQYYFSMTYFRWLDD